MSVGVVSSPTPTVLVSPGRGPEVRSQFLNSVQSYIFRESSVDRVGEIKSPPL